MNPVEQIAVELAARYEQAQGRTVTYVGDGWPPGLNGQVMEWGRSQGYTGVRPTCDLVSRTADGRIARLIEVKGRGTQTSISLADRQRTAMLDYGAHWWLYVAVDCKTAPKLYVIDHPERLPWRQVSAAAEIPAGAYRRVSAEGQWQVGHGEVLAAGELVSAT